MADFRIVVTVDPSRAQQGSRQIERSLDRVGNRADRLRGLITRAFAFAGATAGLTALAAAVRASVSSFAEFERGLIAVGKTTGASGAELEALGVGVRELARTLPVATGEMLSVAQAAGQLGVRGNADILRFVETVGKLGLASNLAGEEAATSLARILTITGESLSDVDRLGSTIVRLGNNFAATEAEIAHVATRVAQPTSQFGVASRDIVGISTALRAVGVRAELGGTAIGRAFQSINDAVRRGGKELETLERITGQTGDTLRRVFFEDSVDAFQSFIEGLGKIQSSGGDVTAALERMGLRGVENAQVLGTLATRSNVVSDALSQANDEWGTNFALTREAAVASTSFSAQMRLVTNVLDEAASELGRALAPALLDATGQMRDFLIEAQRTGELQRIFQDAGAAAKVAASFFGGLASVFQIVGGNLDNLRVAVEALAVVFAVRFVDSQRKAVMGTLSKSRANQVALRSEVARTAAIRDLTRWQLADIRATTRGTAATDRIAQAHFRASAAAKAHAAAQANLAAATRLTSRALTGLKTAYGFLGGPWGVAALAAFAVYEFASANKRARESLFQLPEDIDRFRESLEKLNAAQLQARRLDISEALTSSQGELGDLNSDLKRLDKQLKRGTRYVGTGDFVHLVEYTAEEIKRLENQRIRLAGEIADLRNVIAARQEHLAAVDQTYNFVGPRIPPDLRREERIGTETGGGTGGLLTGTADAAQKAANNLVKINAAANDQIADIALSRVDQITRAEEASVARVLELGQTRGVSEEKVQQAITAIRVSGSLQRQQVEEEATERARQLEQARIQAVRNSNERATRSIALQLESLLPPTSGQ